MCRHVVKLFGQGTIVSCLFKNQIQLTLCLPAPVSCCSCCLFYFVVGSFYSVLESGFTNWYVIFHLLDSFTLCNSIIKYLNGFFHVRPVCSCFCIMLFFIAPTLWYCICNLMVYGCLVILPILVAGC